MRTIIYKARWLGQQKENMMREKSPVSTAAELSELIAAAAGQRECDLVIKNASYLDVFGGEFHRGDIAIHGSCIAGTQESYNGREEIDGSGLYAVPGFIDSHVHIESSLMVPQRFAETVLPRGTTTAIWDPHEIANVNGVDGIRWALDACQNLPMDVFVMLPSCVPSTSPKLALESSGAAIYAADLEPFRNHPRVLGLAEMMNFPGVLGAEEDVLSKLLNFRMSKRDGHSPGLRGKTLNAYLAAGMMSCHEALSYAEAEEKMRKGMHVLVREGSCAKNAQEMLPLLSTYSSAVVALCSDDRNPLDVFEEGHIDAIIDMGLRKGIAPAIIFRAASFAAARAYGLNDRGVIAPGFLADICLVRPFNPADWSQGCKVVAVIKEGRRYQASTQSKLPPQKQQSPNIKVARPLDCNDLALRPPLHGKSASVRVIQLQPGQLSTSMIHAELDCDHNGPHISVQQDVLKIIVLERHHASGRIGIGFVRGFALQKGAIASSINHDSHNIIAVGCSDAAIVTAVSTLQEIDGGIVVYDGEEKILSLPLEVAGLMTSAPALEVAAQLAQLKALTRSLGCTLAEPFLQMSFLALPVIPDVKITDRGLVDVLQSRIVGLYWQEEES